MSDAEQAKAHFFAALDLLDAKDFAAAETELRAALAIVPDRVSALSNLAVALFQQDNLADAIATAERATQLAPEDYEGWLVLGSALAASGDLDQALSAMNRAVAAAPHEPRTLLGRASIESAAKRYDRAIADCRAAIRSGGTDEALGRLVAAQMNACDWTDIDALTDTYIAGIRDGSLRGEPFAFLALPSGPADQLLFARATTARDYPPMAPLYRGEKRSGDRIRVAYLSGDFGQHAVSHLIAGVFDHHDHARFETYGISFGRDDGSDVRARIARAVDHFVDVRGQSDSAVAAFIHDSKIDIVIDLGGFTTGGRPRILAFRPAPVQVNYLGYPGTSGAPYVDYIIADPVIIPPGDERFYSEAVVRLPHTYQANTYDRAVPLRAPGRADAGLPPTGFVFCSFNNAYKINPPVFDVWMQILAAVPDSVLWLLASNDAVADNLRREAEKRGVASSRLIFAPPAPLEDHLARHSLADVFLDTAPYNAHTTATDALRMGLPVVTCPGTTFASRVAASLLRAIDAPELITSSLDEYRELTLTLARDRARLAAVKAKLAANRDTAPLFETARITRYLEAAYTTMVERRRGGLKPVSFAVAELA